MEHLQGQDGEIKGERQTEDEEMESKQHKMIDGADRVRRAHAGLTFIKVTIDFPEAKRSLMLAETTYSRQLCHAFK